MSPRGRHVAVQPGPTADRVYQQVQAAVVVEVSASQSPGDIPAAAERLVGQRNIAEFPRSLVGQQLVAFGVFLPETQVGVPGRAATINIAGDAGNVQSSVVVEIGHDGAETGAVPVGVRQAAGGRLVAEQAAWPLPPQGVRLDAQVGHIEVEQAVVIDITQADPHAREGLAHAVVGHAVEGGPRP